MIEPCLSVVQLPLVRELCLCVTAPPSRLSQGDLIHDNIKVEGNGGPPATSQDRPEGSSPYTHSLTSPTGRACFCLHRIGIPKQIKYAAVWTHTVEKTTLVSENSIIDYVLGHLKIVSIQNMQHKNNHFYRFFSAAENDVVSKCTQSLPYVMGHRGIFNKTKKKQNPFTSESINFFRHGIIYC